MPVTSAFTRVLRERVWHAETDASHASERQRRSTCSSSGGEEKREEKRERGRENEKEVSSGQRRVNGRGERRAGNRRFVSPIGRRRLPLASKPLARRKP